MFCIISEVRHVTTDSAQIQEILVIVEHIAKDFTFPGADVFLLQAQDGFAEVAESIKTSQIKISGYKVIILLLGRADLWAPDRDFRVGVASCLQAIRNLNKNAIIMFTAVIPVPGDTPEVKRTSGYRHGYLAFLAGDANKLEFAKPGKHLLNRGSAIASFFDSFGNLTERGLDQVRRGIEAKSRCASVLKKYEEYFSE